VCITLNFVPCYFSFNIQQQFLIPCTQCSQMYIETCVTANITYLCVRSQNMFWLVSTYICKLCSGLAYICLVTLFDIVLLVVTSISLQYNSTVSAYTVRSLPVLNPVIEVTITTCITDTDVSTVLTLLIYSICKTASNKIIKKKVRIMDKSNIIIVAHNSQTYTWLNYYNV
jgi:hypothetical protein